MKWRRPTCGQLFSLSTGKGMHSMLLRLAILRYWISVSVNQTGRSVSTLRDPRAERVTAILRFLKIFCEAVRGSYCLTTPIRLHRHNNRKRHTHFHLHSLNSQYQHGSDDRYVGRPRISVAPYSTTIHGSNTACNRNIQNTHIKKDEVNITIDPFFFPSRKTCIIDVHVNLTPCNATKNSFLSFLWTLRTHNLQLDFLSNAKNPEFKRRPAHGLIVVRDSFKHSFTPKHTQPKLTSLLAS